jgi:hypothetical protein
MRTFTEDGTFVPFITGASTNSINYILGITQANPAVVTSSAHGLVAGNKVFIRGISSGMTQVNNTVFTVANPAADTFELQTGTTPANVSSTGFDAYSTNLSTIAHAQSMGTPTIFAGTYTRIGNQVMVSGRCQLSSFGDISGELRIDNLPFNTRDNQVNAGYGNQTAAFGTLNISYHSSGVNYPTGASWISAETLDESKQARIYAHGDAIASTALTTADITSTGMDIIFNGMYHAAST